MNCHCGKTLNIGDACIECSMEVPDSFFNYSINVLQGLYNFQRWHPRRDNNICNEVWNVIEWINTAEMKEDFLAGLSMANHLAHYNGEMVTDYFYMPFGFIDLVSNGFDSVFPEVEYELDEIWETGCRVRLTENWKQWQPSSN